MEGEIITRAPLFKREGEGLRTTGLVPTFLPRLERAGIQLPGNFFVPEAFERAG